MKISWLFIIMLVCLAGALNPALAQTGPTRFQFRLPHAAAFNVDQEELQTPAAKLPWLKAWPAKRSGTNYVELGDRLVLQLAPSVQVDPLTAGRLLQVSRVVAPQVYILQ